MKILDCPLNGPRNISEFVYGGEVVEHPEPHTSSIAEWADYVFLENNTAGMVREWWYHAPTAYWIIAECDTVKDEVIRTYPASELYRERMAFPAPPEASEP